MNTSGIEVLPSAYGQVPIHFPTFRTVIKSDVKSLVPLYMLYVYHTKTTIHTYSILAYN